MMNLSRMLSLLLSAVLASQPLAAQTISAAPTVPVAPLALGMPAAPEVGLSVGPVSALPSGFSVQPVSALDQGLLAPTASRLLEGPAAVTPAASARSAARATTKGEKLSDISREAAPKRGRMLGALFDRVLGRKASVEVEEGATLAFRETPKRTQVNGFPLDETPRLPDNANVNKIENYEFNLPQQPRQGLLGWMGRVLRLGAEGDEPPALEGATEDEAGIDAALRGYIGTRPQDFGGLGASDVTNIYVRRVEGKSGLTDTFYAHYVQSKDGLPIHDSFMTFTVKKLHGKMRVLSSRTRVFPNIVVDTQSKFSAAELLEKAQSRIGLPPNSPVQLEAMGQAVKFVGGKWRALQVYSIPDVTIMVQLGVDIATGEAFAWDPRMMADDAQGAKGQVQGRGTNGAFKPGVEMKTFPLAHLKLEFEGGQVVFTDAEGKFTVPGDGTAPVKYKAGLSGRYAHVENQMGANAVIEGSAAPGQELVLVFNPNGADEFKVSEVNSYFHVTLVHDWLQGRGIKEKSLDIAIRVRTNINDECNAYYTPGRPSLNFFKGSSQCSATSFDSVAYHEYGHFVDDMIGGITNGGLSEAWGDVLSMFMIGDPRIGVDFLKNEKVSWIRSGENDYKYRRGDEVHRQGLAYMGYAWLIRKALEASMGAAGLALADHLVVPVLYSKARDIPQAAQEVLLRDMDENGNIPHLEILQKAAQHHGLDVKPPKGLAGLALWISRAFGGSRA